MTVRSIIDIEIDPNGKFREFSKLFEKYQAALKSQPAAWALVNKNIQGTRTSFDGLVDAMVAANVQARLRDKAQERANQLTRTYADRWRDVATFSKRAATSIKDSVLWLLKGSAITGAISGLIGAGGLWGIDRLALTVGAGRRSSLGLGLSYGQQRAFGANFSRLVDPDAFLSSVAEAKMDVTRRVGLIGAGLTPREINADTATTAVALLRNLRRIAQETNPAFYAQVIGARRLQTTPEELLRLRNTPGDEFAAMLRRYGGDVGAFGLPRDMARQWQEFATQMTRAGQSIENTFVRGLAPLAPGLSKLSDSVSKVIQALLGAPELKKWISDLDKGLEKFAAYVGTDEFATNVRTFVSGLAEMAKKVAQVVQWFGGNAAAAPPGTAGGVLTERSGHDTWNEMVQGALRMRQERRARWRRMFGPQAENNPGNLRPPGSPVGFQQFASPEQGVLAMARQLQLYARRDHLDTVAGIVSKYAPPSENDTAAYIADVSRRTGFAPGQHLNLGDSQTLASLVAAMIRHEQRPGRYDKYKDAKVVVQVIKPAGGDTAVSVNGIKD